jgi:hypothetical protein
MTSQPRPRDPQDPHHHFPTAASRSREPTVALYRTLLESGRRQPGTPPRRHDPATLALIEELHDQGLTWHQVADQAMPGCQHALQNRSQHPSPGADRWLGSAYGSVRWAGRLVLGAC